jgi:hypothetical protein
MPALFCARPHVKTVDFLAARLVVGREVGLDVGTAAGVQHLEMGDEIAPGALDEYALRCLYDAPVRAIETLEYTATIPHLREAHARRCGTTVESDSEEQPEAEVVRTPPQPKQKTKQWKKPPVTAPSRLRGGTKRG